VLGFAVREIIPPEGLLASHLFQQFATLHPSAARNVANLVLLAPGFVIGFGFFFIVFFIYMVPALRGRMPLTPAQRSLVFIAGATVLFMSLIRSWVLLINDFGMRAPLIFQFALLLLGSEIITIWNLADSRPKASDDSLGFVRTTPQWLRSAAALTLVIGIFGTVYWAGMLRFALPLTGAAQRGDLLAGNVSHNAYISSIGYAELDAAIPHDAIVQPNPTARPNAFWSVVDTVGIDHQVAITNDKPWCGSELGGDPSGCPAMAAAIDALFSGATAEQAHATCRQYGIQYLVVRIYDPAWNDKSGWAWTLNPVVSNDEFRALDCR
jgi:hypothetical protein